MMFMQGFGVILILTVTVNGMAKIDFVANYTFFLLFFSWSTATRQHIIGFQCTGEEHLMW